MTDRSGRQFRELRAVAEHLPELRGVLDEYDKAAVSLWEAAAAAYVENPELFHVPD